MRGKLSSIEWIYNLIANRILRHYSLNNNIAMFRRNKNRVQNGEKFTRLFFREQEQSGRSRSLAG